MTVFTRNIPLLALSQALMMTAMSLILTTAALVGYELAADKSLATLPVTTIFIAIMLTSIPASMLMGRIGRKAGFMLATLVGVAGGIVSTLAIMQSNFWLFLLGTSLVGVFNGFGNYYRFAAADAVDHEHKGRAVSYIMLGGVAAAVVGPNLANMSREWIASAAFAGSYASLIGLYLLSFIVLGFLRLPKIETAKLSSDDSTVRSLKDIVTQPKYIVALICGMLGYGVMTLVMTATPLAMRHHAHQFSDTSFIIQWHVLGMFAPSFVTGQLIQRFGLLKIMFVGGLLGLACVGVNLLGHSLTHYWFALVLLGISWNFLFVGATTLLTETYHPVEQAKAQAANDFAVFSVVALSSLFAGALQHQFGWQAVNLGVIPFLFIVLASLFWLNGRYTYESSAVDTNLEPIKNDAV